MRTAFAIATLVAITAGTAEARTSYTSQPMRQAGVLTCSVDGSVGYVVGSRRRVMCTYESFGRRSIRETYVGHIERVGFDVGVASGQVISWTVWSAGGRSRHGMLSGMFAGESAEATVVFGPGTEALFGDNGDRIALQPRGRSGQAGLNLAFGATSLDLRPARYGYVPVYTAPVYYARPAYRYWGPSYGYGYVQ